MDTDRLQGIPLHEVVIDDLFWNRYTGLVDEVILPYMWELINDRVEGAEKSYCMHNFRVACGEEKGVHKGEIFQDTDVAKWLEAAAYSLAKKKNPGLEEKADEAIDLISRAQCEDGYLNTYYSITREPRWSNLSEGHELYTAGHMIEAAVAYYEATGKRKFLDTMCRCADNLCEVFGPEEGKIHGYPGHPEAELALIKLYHATNEKKYLHLAEYFVRERGMKPPYFLQEACWKEGKHIFPEFESFGLDYFLADRPLAEQTAAEGHAVRAGYLFSAMADLACELQDDGLEKQCEALWENIVDKKLYITGGAGSAAFGERFTCDYDLPNTTNYSESCASIGMAMFSNRMFRNTRNGKYMDIVEKELYNTILSGIALDGKHFFYVNPMEVRPEITEHTPVQSHIKTERQKWFGVACCPPNIARTLASLSSYAFDVSGDTLFINLFIGSRIHAEGLGTFLLTADYPASGRVTLTVKNIEKDPVKIAFRIPGGSRHYDVCVNGEPREISSRKGYCYLLEQWKTGDCITIDMDVDFHFIYCNPEVGDNVGKTALMKGPWVYCLEETDNGRGLHTVFADTDSQVGSIRIDSLPDGIPCASFRGKIAEETPEGLYLSKRPEYRDILLKAIPYCLWNNRGKGEMTVWMHDFYTWGRF